MNNQNGPAWTIDGVAGVSLVSPRERNALIATLPYRGRMLEIGTHRGATIADLARRRPDCRFICLDMFCTQPRSEIMEQWHTNISPLPNVVGFLGTSADLLAWRPRPFDVVFVDGGHDYEPCKADLIAAKQLITAGGAICVHDYTCLCFPGIRRAVKEELGVSFDRAAIIDTMFTGAKQ